MQNQIIILLCTIIQILYYYQDSLALVCHIQIIISIHININHLNFKDQLIDLLKNISGNFIHPRLDTHHFILPLV